MKRIYEKLFDTYCCSVLDEAESFDDWAINESLDALSLDTRTKNKLDDLFYDNYIQWSTDAFAAGLHLGLSLMPSQRQRKEKQGASLTTRPRNSYSRGRN